MVMPGEEGQLERMAETIVEEYVRMGWDQKRLMTLFTNPMFMATYRVYQIKGADYVENLVQQTCARYQPAWQVAAASQTGDCFVAKNAPRNDIEKVNKEENHA